MGRVAQNADFPNPIWEICQFVSSFPWVYTHPPENTHEAAGKERRWNKKEHDDGCNFAVTGRDRI
jgi:hypothetical protein